MTVYASENQIKQKCSHLN